MKLTINNGDGTTEVKEIGGLAGALLTILVLAIIATVFVFLLPVFAILIFWALAVAAIAFPVVYFKDRADKKRWREQQAKKPNIYEHRGLNRRSV